MKLPACLYCEKSPLPKGRRKYCSDECSERYFVERLYPLWWANATKMALERAGHRCEECGSDGTVRSWDYLGGYRPLEVHHIIPLDPGEKRHNSPKNRQDNLRVLCKACHEWVHHLLRALPLAEVRLRLDGRLPLFEWAGVAV